MAHQTIDGITNLGRARSGRGTLAQAMTCSQIRNVARTLLMVDHHMDYSQPIGGVQI